MDANLSNMYQFNQIWQKMENYSEILEERKFLVNSIIDLMSLLNKDCKDEYIIKTLCLNYSDDDLQNNDLNDIFLSILNMLFMYATQLTFFVHIKDSIFKSKNGKIYKPVSYICFENNNANLCIYFSSDGNIRRSSSNSVIVLEFLPVSIDETFESTYTDLSNCIEWYNANLSTHGISKDYSIMTLSEYTIKDVLNAAQN